MPDEQRRHSPALSRAKTRDLEQVLASKHANADESESDGEGNGPPLAAAAAAVAVAAAAVKKSKTRDLNYLLALDQGKGLDEAHGPPLGCTHELKLGANFGAPG